MAKQKVNIKAQIVEQLLEIMTAAQANGTNWVMPFGGSSGAPVNALTRNKYRGMNSLFLTMIGGTHFATYNQWGELGAQVRKGERGTKITVPMPVKDKVTGEAAGIYWKGATVFSAGQVDGWDAPATKTVDETERNATVDAFTDNIGVEVNYSGQGAAFYRPATDSIQMPHRAQFKATDTSTATETFYSTLLHEYVHSTGHKSRLDRLGSKNQRGYAYEELVAEIGATMLCVELGVSPAAREDHGQYLASWIKVLDNDHDYIFKAASEAQKAVDYLHGLQSSQLEEAA